MSGQESFQRLDDPPEVGLILVIVVQPLGIQNIVHGDQALILVLNSRPVSAKLLHLTSNSEKESKMDAECSNIRSGFTTDPKDAHVSLVVVFNEFVLVDGSNTELTLDG